MLGTLPDDRKANWKDYVSPLVHAYNATKHESTGYSPFYLMFGREPRIPVDVQFGLDPNLNNSATKDSSKFVEKLRDRLKLAYDLATRSARAASKRNKEYYDAKKCRREARLLPGDRVLLRNVRPSGKLDNKWEKEIFVVDRKPSQDIPVYIVRKEDGTGRKRTVHRNLLLPCPLVNVEQEPAKQCPRKESLKPGKPSQVMETPVTWSDEEGDSPYAIRVRKSPQRIRTTPPPQVFAEDASTTFMSPSDKETSGILLDQSASLASPVNVSNEHSSPPEQSQAEREPRPRRIRHPPRWMADPNWVCSQHTVPAIHSNHTIVYMYVPFLCYLVPTFSLFPLPLF